MSSQLTIFYADDDRDDLDFFREVLDGIKREIELYTHSGGQSLLTALQNPPPRPNMVFLDLNMPGKNGFDVLEEMRDSNELKDVPVIIFSTSDDRNAVERSRELGANLYLRKPTSYDNFKTTIQKMLDINWSHFKADPASFYIG